VRPIKFRAWEKNLRAMISVDSINFEAGLINMELVWRTFEEIELMQYTGSKDKNGVEIYEGDIVETPSSKTKYLVDYVEGSFVGRIKYREYTTLYKGLEVIGNIYEDSDLIK
jgi:uncharacterized phage protein (TIGR01671 family)